MIRLILTLAATLFLGHAAAAEVQIKEVTSPGGFRIWLVEDHSIPFTALELRFKGGTSLDLPEKAGATLLMSALLEEGAGDLTSQDFAEAREALAAEFQFDAYPDALSVSARMLSDNRDAAVDLLRQALVEPAFEVEAIDRVRAQIVSIIQSQAQDPGAIAAEKFNALAFGTHPYAVSRYGTVDSVAALTRDDILAAKAAVIARDRVFVSVVGDVTAEQVGAMVDHLLGALPETGAPMPQMAEVNLSGGVTIVDFPTPQSVVAFGQAGIARTDPDFFPAFVLNEALGGSGFAARLMEEVREKRGLTYGISSYLVPMQFAATWQGSVASANAKVAETIEVVRTEWAKAASEGLTQAELDAAKTYLTGSYPLRFDGNGPIADILVGMQMDGMPIDYVTTRNAQVEAVTLEDVRRVAAKLMQPDGLRFVVVGQPENLLPTP